METRFLCGFLACCIDEMRIFADILKILPKMKKVTLILSLFLGFIPMLNAQWTSPGNGTTYTIDDLIEVSEGCVVWNDSNQQYRIENDVTISANDKLDVNHSLYFGNNVTLTIKGSIEAINTDTYYWLAFSGNSGVGARIRLEDATAPCVFRRCYITQLDGIQVIESEVVFTDCHFQNFRCEQQSAVVNCMNCDPVFTNCEFDNNNGSAISSPANGQTSPQVTDCIFFLNLSNNPHINLGPGNTKILLKNNDINHNRYGYNQQGYHLSSTIIGNTFDQNNLETNPMNGGSGIRIYGIDENNKAYIRNNVITKNLWGITVINAADVNLGTEDDWGNNVIHDNGHITNYGMDFTYFDLYNNSANDIMAVGNYWGTTDAQVIEEHITHQNDDPNLGLVNYIPFLEDDDVSESNTTDFEVWPNPVSDATFTLTLENAIPSELVIYNVNGKMVKTQRIDNSVNTIRIDTMGSGIYFVELKNDNGTKVKKLIVK